jgi:hypothetical protein
VATAIAAASPDGLALALRHHGTATVTISGQPVTLTPDEVIVTQTPLAGWTVASEAGETVALEVTITPELRREGYAREVVRLVQEARKADGLEVGDHIVLRWATADPDLGLALSEFGRLIQDEVLAVDYAEVPSSGHSFFFQTAAGGEAEPLAGSGVVAGAADRAEMGLTAAGSALAGPPVGLAGPGGETGEELGSEHADTELGLTFWIRRA